MARYFLCWKNFEAMRLHVCSYVCLGVFDKGEKMDGLIGTEEVPLDAPERGKDEGADC